MFTKHPALYTATKKKLRRDKLNEEKEQYQLSVSGTAKLNNKTENFFFRGSNAIKKFFFFLN